ATATVAAAMRRPMKLLRAPERDVLLAVAVSSCGGPQWAKSSVLGPPVHSSPAPASRRGVAFRGLIGVSSRSAGAARSEQQWSKEHFRPVETCAIGSYYRFALRSPPTEFPVRLLGRGEKDSKYRGWLTETQVRRNIDHRIANINAHG